MLDTQKSAPGLAPGRHARPPFSTPALAPRADNDLELQVLLPATRRTEDDNIVVAQIDHDFLEDQLLVRTLDEMKSWLWLCGRPMPPRPLHHQLLLSREIHLTETMGLHLVWTEKRIFIKPLPPYLLEPVFWEAYLAPGGGEPCCDHAKTEPCPICRRRRLYHCAMGFLFTYTALVAHESDFRIAQRADLLPLSVTWPAWRLVCAEFLSGGDHYTSINPRFWYGELRLSRLNKIVRFRTCSLRGYSHVDASSSFDGIFRKNFAWLAAALAYVAIVLTAMQVGLATERLQLDEAFQWASFVFTVFSIVTPLVAVLAITAFVLVLVVINARATGTYGRRRFHAMGVEPPWKQWQLPKMIKVSSHVI